MTNRRWTLYEVFSRHWANAVKYVSSVSGTPRKDSIYTMCLQHIDRWRQPIPSKSHTCISMLGKTFANKILLTQTPYYTRYYYCPLNNIHFVILLLIGYATCESFCFKECSDIEILQTIKKCMCFVLVCVYLMHSNIKHQNFKEI